jgi:DNA-binding response OmpR family regulator
MSFVAALEHPAGSPTLSAQELAVLAVLVELAGRVVSRQELARRAGLADRSERRCDAILVQLRRFVGPASIRTVRSRGWILDHDALDTARALLAQA